MRSPRIVFLAPVRSLRPDRQRLWDFTRRWWAEQVPEVPIFEGAGPLDGPFNRGAAVNEAARSAGNWDIAVIIDTDVVADPAQVHAAIERAAETGRLTFAFEDYRALDSKMTERVLAGFDGNWAPGARLKMKTHQSSIVVVPRPLWDATGGFDERCEGWGSDDLIFAHAARVLGGGCERVAGAVWHLHHAVSAHRAKEDPGQVAAGHLAHRYFTEHSVAGMEALIAERHQTGAMVIVVITDGRRECIDRTLPLAWQNLKGLPLARTIICDDSGDPEYAAWLRWRFPEAEVVISGKRSGFAGAVRRGWAQALGSGQPWVLWLEDDFLIPEPVDLSAIAKVMDEHPYLTQVVLRRQPWFPSEIAAGGIIDADPTNHFDATDGTNHWVEHHLGWWTNPCLVRRSFLAAHSWPQGPNSEARFARTAMVGDARSAYWGKRTDPPSVTHMGERRGSGY